jgi:hypothetical protein
MNIGVNTLMETNMENVNLLMQQSAAATVTSMMSSAENLGLMMGQTNPYGIEADGLMYLGGHGLMSGGDPTSIMQFGATDPNDPAAIAAAQNSSAMYATYGNYGAFNQADQGMMYAMNMQQQE